LTVTVPENRALDVAMHGDELALHDIFEAIGEPDFLLAGCHLL
jgi:hypothetical protein